MSEGMLSFLGAIGGGFITLFGVLITIVYYRHKDKSDYKHVTINNAKTFYYFILAKVTVVIKAKDLLKSREDIICVANNIICSNEDKLFTYQYLRDVQECLCDSDVRELGAFIEQLAVAESFREDSRLDINKGNGIARANKYLPENLSNQNNYKDSIVACVQLLNGGETSKGIISILDKLEKIVVNED